MECCYVDSIDEVNSDMYMNCYVNNGLVFLDWQVIRTIKSTHMAQFDLMKDVRVRVYTLLSGPCTNGTMVKSTSFIKLVQKPPSTGVS